MASELRWEGPAWTYALPHTECLPAQKSRGTPDQEESWRKCEGFHAMPLFPLGEDFEQRPV